MRAWCCLAIAWAGAGATPTRACDPPAAAVTVVPGDAAVVVVLSHAGPLQPTSCATGAAVPRRTCTAEHDLVCQSGPCRPHNDRELPVLGRAFAAHLGVCLGRAPTLVVAELRRDIVDVGRDADDVGGTTCALGADAARPYWDAFYGALDGAIAAARERGHGRALVVDVHTHRTLPAAPAPAVILGAGRPFGSTARALLDDDSGARVFGAAGLRRALLQRLEPSFAGVGVWPDARTDVDDELFVGRHLLTWSGARADALQLELSDGPRNEPDLSAWLVADAFCDALAPWLWSLTTPAP